MRSSEHHRVATMGARASSTLVGGVRFHILDSNKHAVAASSVLISHITPYHFYGTSKLFGIYLFFILNILKRYS